MGRDTDLARDDEPDRLDGARRELETASNFVLPDIDGVSGQEGESSLCHRMSSGVSKGGT